MKTGVKTILIIVLVLGGCFMAVIGMGAFYVFSAKTVPLTAGDKALLIGPEDMKEYFDDWEPKEDCVTYEKTKYLDGAVELSLEYDSPDDDEPYISSSIEYERKRSDILATYAVNWNAVKLGLTLGDDKFEVVESSDFKIGQRSRFGLLKYDGIVVGTLLVFLKGRNVYTFQCTGFYIDDPDTLHEIFDDVAAGLGNHK